MEANGATQEIDVMPPAAIVAPKAMAKPTTPRAIVMAEALKEDTEQRALLQMYVSQHMKTGTDYGVIPGTNKPTLLKPGAEKLTDLFRCTPSFDLIEKIEDWEKGLFHYTFRVRITSRDAGTVLAEGFGSANSREGRYRWRNAHRKCPECEKEAIFKSKFPPRDNPDAAPGWYCHKKAGGCGANFAAGDERIESQTEGKVENDDIYTLVNTILKMAKKRALVDGAIALARCSDIFTQDVEDMVDEEPHSAPPPQRAARQAPRNEAPKRTQEPKPEPTPAQPKAQRMAPPYVLSLWNRTVAMNGGSKEMARKAYESAARAVFGETPKPSNDWTEEDALNVESHIMPSDVP
jgi:hypothetical protein